MDKEQIWGIGLFIAIMVIIFYTANTAEPHYKIDDYYATYTYTEKDGCVIYYSMGIERKSCGDYTIQPMYGAKLIKEK